MALGFITVLRRKIAAMPVGKDIGIPKLDKLAAQVKSGSEAFLSIE